MSLARRPANRRGALGFLFQAFAATLLMVLGAAQLFPALHYTLQRHEVCAEHGELRHASDETHAAANAERAPESASLISTSADHGDDHEHCGVTATSQDRVVLRSPNAVELPHFKRVLLGFVQISERGLSRISVLAYAPKHAPPA